MTGSAPGKPRQVGQVWLFGSAPNSTGHAQNILLTRLELDVDLEADGRQVFHFRIPRTKDTKVTKKD